MGKSFWISVAFSAVLIAALQFHYSPPSPTNDKPNPKLPPVAFSLYCLKHIVECPAKGPKRVSLTPQILSAIAYVQHQVNAEIVPRMEQQDVWQADVAAGDCDDYVMTKRRRLINAGIPATAMGVKVFRLADGQGHVTLLVRTTQGTFELDNLKTGVIRRF
ncbi:putative transglutaminase-like cysteine proteinase [Pararhizobium capsulatum DSM 1112]|uniref:Transglutaminase-like cysteine proteinase n=1 Tax=Pararhizobium capsulatum DSM 1112 TaxID=1121113 RepID=A0ABU0BW35_9HYPH|nr:transglutaminase-like cysteine peptidase [Pararhizobium capsulatum]MDQ0321665.1 putative transglutaminase-like cysteine proteinase [Pararhizobium capsulatum DSM 1112]